MFNRRLLTIFLIVFIDLFGFGLIIPLLPFIAERFNANPFQIGLLTSTYPFFQFIGSPVLGRLSDRFGRKTMLVISQIGTVIGYLILGFSNSLWLIFLSRVIDGITGGNISIAQAYIADSTDEKNRARGMALVGAAFGLGYILGPALGGLLYSFGFSTPAFFSAFISMITVLTTLFFLEETVNLKNAKHSEKTKLSFEKLQTILKTQPIGLIIISFFLINFSFSMMTGNFALWTENTFAYGPTQNGWLFTFIGIILTVTQLIIIPWLANRYHEKHLIQAGVLISGLGIMGVLFVFSPIYLYPALTFIAVGNGITNPNIQSLASKSVNKDEYGGTLGFLQSFGSMGRILGPAIGGFLFASYNKDAPIIFSALLMWLVYLLLNKYLKDEKGFVALLHRIKRTARL